MTSSGPNPGPYEALYVSPHDDDVLVSCPGRMLSERAQGLRALVVVAFSGEPRQGRGETGQALARLGFDVERLGLAPAQERSGFYDSYLRRTFERDPEDERVLADLASRLTALVLQTKARHIYLPLGADGHVDHKISLEAGLRALHEVTGRNVFLYEERPHALLPGAIRIRLSELAVRLPPAAADIHDGASLARVAVTFGCAPFLAGERLGPWERARATGRMAASHRASRAWNPARALGLRLQPVLETMDAADLEGLLGLLVSAEPYILERFGSRERLARDAARHAKRLSGRAYAERYWLLLPPRDEGGLATLKHLARAPDAG